MINSYRRKARSLWLYRHLLRAWLKANLNRHAGVDNDATWFMAQLDPGRLAGKVDVALASLPPKEIQLRFTGRYGFRNLWQAYEFYCYISAVTNLSKRDKPKILDFGGGWGRISRFFLRDTAANHIWIADVMQESMEWLRQTGNPSNHVKNEPLPPLPGIETKFDLIYAFSVFSHLSQDYFHTWTDTFIDLLKPGGYLVFTTRGERFIDYMEFLASGHGDSDLVRYLPAPKVLRSGYEKGEFQFYSMAGGDELSSEYYGETLIPPDYVAAKYEREFVSCVEDLESVDQAVMVLRKPDN